MSFTINSIEDELASVDIENIDKEMEFELAAKIGKILLEKNKDLERNLEQRDHVIMKQQQEIDQLVNHSNYLEDLNITHVNAVRELESNVQELSQMNQSLSKQTSQDQQSIDEILDQKETLEKRCAVLQSSHACIENELIQLQNQLNNVHNESLDAENHPKMDVIMNVECARHEGKNEVIEKLNKLSTQLIVCTDEIMRCQRHVAQLEEQFNKMMQRTIDFEDIITSRLTPTSGYSSRAEKNSESLMSEITSTYPNCNYDPFKNSSCHTSTPARNDRKLATFSQQTADESFKTCEVDTSSYEIYENCVDELPPNHINIDYEHEMQCPAYLNTLLDYHNFQESLNNSSVCSNPAETERNRSAELTGFDKGNAIYKYFHAVWILTKESIFLRPLALMLRPIAIHFQFYFGRVILWTNKNKLKESTEIV